MSFWAYIVLCSDDSSYTGQTDSLQARVVAHNDGTYGGYTETRRPVELVWSQDFGTRAEALEAERQIKGWSRALIKGDWEMVHRKALRRTPQKATTQRG